MLYSALFVLLCLAVILQPKVVTVWVCVSWLVWKTLKTRSSQPRVQSFHDARCLLLPRPTLQSPPVQFFHTWTKASQLQSVTLELRGEPGIIKRLLSMARAPLIITRKTTCCLVVLPQETPYVLKIHCTIWYEYVAFYDASILPLSSHTLLPGLSLFWG